jgi:hypothetical protein
MVDKGLFLRVQTILNGNKRTGGRREQQHNIFQGRYDKEVSKREAALVTLSSEIAADSRGLAVVEHPIKDFSKWQSDIEKLKASLDQPESRRRLNAHLSEFIDKIEVFTKGFGTNHEDEFAGWYYYIQDEYGPTLSKRDSKAFVSWVEAKRATKEGRFLRLWFKQRKPRSSEERFFADIGNTGYDIPVAGSVGGWPDMGLLWEQFCQHTGLFNLPTKNATASVRPNSNGSNGHLGRGAKKRNAGRSDIISIRG